MRNKIYYQRLFVAVIWLSLGILRLFDSVLFLIHSASRLYIYMPPDEILSKSIVIGGVYIVIGILLIAKPKIVVFEIYSIVLWLLSFSFLWTVVYILKYLDFNVVYLLVLDYLIILIAALTIKALKNEGVIDNALTFKTKVYGNTKKLMVEMLLFNLLIFLVSIFV